MPLFPLVVIHELGQLPKKLANQKNCLGFLQYPVIQLT